MSRLGTISFQSSDESDVFHVAEVYEDGLEPSDEMLLAIEDPQFDSEKAWVTGKTPKIKPLQVDGDNSIIQAWFRGEVFDNPFVITVYLECELAEELIEVEADENVGDEDDSSDLEPQEVNL